MQHALKLPVDDYKIILPDDRSHLRKYPSLLLFYQLRKTMTGLFVKVQLIQFSFDPHRSFVSFGDGFLNASGYLRKCENGFMIIRFWHAFLIFGKFNQWITV